MPDGKGGVEWTEYDLCEHCGQSTGEPCRDLRYRRQARVAHSRRPHSTRQRTLGQVRRGRPPIGGEVRQELGNDRRQRIEKWAKEHQCSRAEAVRVLLDRALDSDAVTHVFDTVPPPDLADRKIQRRTPRELYFMISPHTDEHGGKSTMDTAAITASDLLRALGAKPDVTVLNDEELKAIIGHVDDVVWLVRGEQAVRRREARDRRALNRIGARGSCVLCHKVFVVEALTKHITQDHSPADLRMLWNWSA